MTTDLEAQMLISNLPELVARRRRVAVGVFDGVHLGHQAVIRGCDTVVTFDRHPRGVINPGEMPPRLLTDQLAKLRRLAALGVAEVVVLCFDERMARKPAAEFIDDVLVDQLQATHIRVGPNFRFGASAAGDVAHLCAESRFLTTVVPAMSAGGETVSSTRIRELVDAGFVEEAGVMLGTPLSHPALVRTVRMAGNPAGQLTCLDFDHRLAVPGPGSYACLVNGLDAVVRVGARTTRLVTNPLVSSFDVMPQIGVVEVQFLQRLTTEAHRAFDLELDRIPVPGAPQTLRA